MYLAPDYLQYTLDPHAERKLARILSVQPDHSRPLAHQFNFALESAYEWAIGGVHDFSLGCAPKPSFRRRCLAGYRASTKRGSTTTCANKHSPARWPTIQTTNSPLT